MEKIRGLNKAQLQIIAVIGMTIDHASFLMPTLFWFYACKFIGKITIVTMCFFVAEGYHRTHNIKRYILRMMIFAAAAELPFFLFEKYGSLPGDPIGWIRGMYHCKNVIFTLLIGLCLLTVLKSKCHIVFKILAIPVAWFLMKGSDWRYYGALWVLAFGLFRGSKKRQFIAAAVIAFCRFMKFFVPIIILFAQAYLPQSGALTLFIKAARHINSGDATYSSLYASITQLGLFLPLVMLWWYNGKKGNAPRLLFYIYYPAHLLVLFLIKVILF